VKCDFSRVEEAYDFPSGDRKAKTSQTLTGRNWRADAENVWSKKQKKALRAPTPGGVFQIETFLGFFLTTGTKLHDLNCTARARKIIR
jgi:hypothetical protein